MVVGSRGGVDMLRTSADYRSGRPVVWSGPPWCDSCPRLTVVDYDNDKGKDSSFRKFLEYSNFSNFTLESSGSSGSVTWRLVSRYILEARYYRILPGTAGYYRQ
eukprot:842105-Amorphochlora_amoeboformis.AAC.1